MSNFFLAIAFSFQPQPKRFCQMTIGTYLQKGMDSAADWRKCLPTKSTEGLHLQVVGLANAKLLILLK